MIARLICLLLGHSLDELAVLEGAQPPIYVTHGRCARCKTPVITVRDLRDEKDQQADVDTVDERSDRLK